VSVRLVESGVTDAVGLSAVDVSVDWWFFATRPAQSGVVVVEGNDEDRVYSPTTSVGVGVLEELFGGSLVMIDDNDLQCTWSASLIELEIITIPVGTPRTSGARLEKA
jgi:hypothetical protein